METETPASLVAGFAIVRQPISTAFHSCAIIGEQQLEGRRMLTCFYLALIVIAGGYIAFSFIVGELIDFGEDVGHAVEGVGDSISGALDSVGHAIEGVFGGAEAAGADIGEIAVPEVGEIGLEHEIEGAGPSPLSLRTVAMFAVGFGAGGLIGQGVGLSDPLTLLPASGLGLGSAIPMWLFLRFLYGEQASTSIQAPDYVGLVGRVTIAIPEGRPGQVALIVRGQRMNVPARSEDGSPIRAQTQVEVLSMEGGMVVVREF
jgi:membrane protein implicated in regulation of membrane protease activity